MKEEKKEYEADEFSSTPQYNQLSLIFFLQKKNTIDFCYFW